MSVARLLSFLFRLAKNTFMMESLGKYYAPRTIEYQFDRIADTVSYLQKLSRCHASFFLCQFIQSLESVLDLRLSQQLLQILFWPTISGTDINAGI